MAWQNTLDELKKAALAVSNQELASESIIRVKHLTLQHSADHWEELHTHVHAIFGWGQEGVPWMQAALDLCYRNQSVLLHFHMNPPHTTTIPLPDTQQEYIKILRSSDGADKESSDESGGAYNSWAGTVEPLKLRHMSNAVHWTKTRAYSSSFNVSVVIIVVASKQGKADVQLSETDRKLKEYFKDPRVHQACQLLENDDYGQVFLELFKHANLKLAIIWTAYTFCLTILAVSLTTLPAVVTKVSQLFWSWIAQWFMIMTDKICQGLIPRILHNVWVSYSGREVVDESSLASQVHVLIEKSGGRAGLAVISYGSDGALSEVGAHNIIHNSALEWLTFSIKKFSGPLLTVPDMSHIQKVLRNNEQSGTCLLSVGNHCLTHQTLVTLWEEPNSGMVKKDVENTDKHNDRAAIRLFHSNAL
ncbi:uncharacterized protein F5147DRAFT_652986 [Suillus discolor]|uniref:Uncharacterized protein n=1 Tax=Suillus discolor TaxID=1912936 RepID=A0A9P7F6A2_9AGAM|nr:uncharacterized protein F5147DRAFT_652986 [Suillus discolor]KAG2108271.1 hypothetical protein F5147DRAFT_652986 [Suillus discolor]